MYSYGYTQVMNLCVVYGDGYIRIKYIEQWRNIFVCMGLSSNGNAELEKCLQTM